MPNDTLVPANWKAHSTVETWAALRHESFSDLLARRDFLRSLAEERESHWLWWQRLLRTGTRVETDEGTWLENDDGGGFYNAVHVDSHRQAAMKYSEIAARIEMMLSWMATHPGEPFPFCGEDVGFEQDAGPEPDEKPVDKRLPRYPRCEKMLEDLARIVGDKERMRRAYTQNDLFRLAGYTEADVKWLRGVFKGSGQADLWPKDGDIGLWVALLTDAEARKTSENFPYVSTIIKHPPNRLAEGRGTP
jgi:hypothetical protein